MIRFLAFLLYCIVTVNVHASSIHSQLDTPIVKQTLQEQQWHLLELLLHQESLDTKKHLHSSEPKQLEEAIRLSKRHIPVQLDYRHTHLNKSLYFQDAHFAQSPLIQKSDVKAEVAFDDAIFEQDLDLYWNRFYEQLSFQRVRLRSTMYLTSSLVKAPFLFNQAFVEQSAFFNSTVFHGPVSFVGSQCGETLSFQMASFHDTANLSEMTVGQHLDFTDASINDLLDLKHSRINGSLVFRGATIELPPILSQVYIGGSIDFSQAKINQGIVDLSEIFPLNHQEKIGINLSRTDPNRFLLSYDRFALEFDDNLSHGEKVFLYESIIDTQKKHGFTQGVREASIEYKHYLYLHEGSYITDFIQHYGWDYGFDRERVLLWILAVILLIASVNALFYRYLVEDAFSVPFLSRHAHSHYVESNPILRYIFYFPATLVFTLLILFSHAIGIKHELDALKSRSVWVNSYLFFLMLVGVTCSLFMLNYIFGGSLK